MTKNLYLLVHNYIPQLEQWTCDLSTKCKVLIRRDMFEEMFAHLGEMEFAYEERILEEGFSTMSRSQKNRIKRNGPRSGKSQQPTVSFVKKEVKCTFAYFLSPTHADRIQSRPSAGVVHGAEKMSKIAM